MSDLIIPVHRGAINFHVREKIHKKIGQYVTYLEDVTYVFTHKKAISIFTGMHIYS